MQPARARGDLGKNLILMCTVILVADVCLAQLAKLGWDLWDVRRTETRYRIRSATHHHELAPNAVATGVWGYRRYPLRTNSLGFKDENPRDVPLESERQRILLIGDSVTEGVGFAYEKTFAGIISRSMRQRDIEVLNAAVVSYAPSLYYRRIRHLLEEVGLRFDEVVVFIDISDIHDEAEFYGLDEQDNVIAVHEQPGHWISPDADSSTRARIESFLANNSVLYRFASTFLLPLFRATPEWEACWSTDLHRSLWTVNDDLFEEYGRKGIRQGMQQMDRLRDLLEERGIGLAVAVYPWPDQVKYHDLESRQVVLWRDWAKRRGARFLNFFPDFVTGDDPRAVIDSYFIPCDMHFNEAGHRRMAEAYLREYGRGDRGP